MAKAPLLQLSDISLTFGGEPLFRDVSLTVQQGDRVALVGRNGSGKSTLMKIMAGLVEADTGTRTVPPGISVGYMEQHPDISGFATLGEFAASELDAGEEYRVEMVAEGLKFDPGLSPQTASGGERRRAALAKLLAEDIEEMVRAAIDGEFTTARKQLETLIVDTGMAGGDIIDDVSGIVVDRPEELADAIDAALYRSWDRAAIAARISSEFDPAGIAERYRRALLDPLT